MFRSDLDCSPAASNIKLTVEKNQKMLYKLFRSRIIHVYMHPFYKRVHLKLIELERKRSWLLERTGVKPSTWSSWERNGRYPPADRAVEIASSLGVSVEYLVTGRETPFDLRGEHALLNEIVQILSDLDPEQLAFISQLVDGLSHLDGPRLDQVLTLTNSLRLHGDSR